MALSILVVDDEADVAELFRQRFRREVREGRYQLHFAASGEEGLLRVAELGPELIVILSDINMPGMDGLTLLREIKQRRPELPVVMVTAYGDDERVRTAEHLGAAAFCPSRSISSASSSSSRNSCHRYRAADSGSALDEP